ncbi:hypothetical protein Vadar_009750 [Vaccinium darrowii]|uniref:Uncharacterized protein n=1 Tax=Vaccinium darrowii TaxID=229202 RepID=A0ACB7Z3F8_9ERIC|nr:hypothetical protein Vadar_009750 [Vaccinium darrowii]
MLPKIQAESAIVSRGMTETEPDEQREEERVDKSMSTFKILLWHGGSVYDAWFSCASNLRSEEAMVPQKQAESAIVSRGMTEPDEQTQQREEESVGLFMMPGSTVYQT